MKKARYFLKLGEYIKERYNIVHIKQTDTMTRNDALTTPLYGYNKKYGVYEALDVNGDAPLHNMIFNITDDIEIPSGKMSETLKYIKATAPYCPLSILTSSHLRMHCMM